jgi:hypothetical protein
MQAAWVQYILDLSSLPLNIPDFHFNNRLFTYAQASDGLAARAAVFAYPIIFEHLLSH